MFARTASTNGSWKICNSALNRLYFRWSMNRMFTGFVDILFSFFHFEEIKDFKYSLLQMREWLMLSLPNLLSENANSVFKLHLVLLSIMPMATPQGTTYVKLGI